MVWRNLLRRPGRTGLTILGVSVGLALIVALGAIADGYSLEFSAMASSSGAHLTVMQANSADMALSAVDEQAGRRIAAIPGVAGVSGTMFSAVPLQGTPYFLVFGYDPAGFSFAHFKVVEGKRLSPRAAASQSREIMLGRTAAESLKKRVGETIKLYNTPYRVVAIFETGISFEEGAGVVSLKEAQRTFRKPHQVSMYGVKLDSPDQVERVRRQILERVDDVAKLITLMPVAAILPTIFLPRLFIQVTVTALLLGAVGGFYPAFRAANLRPVEALHDE